MGVHSVDPHSEKSVARLLLSDVREYVIRNATMLSFDPQRKDLKLAKHVDWPDQRKQVNGKFGNGFVNGRNLSNFPQTRGDRRLKCATKPREAI